MRKDLSSRATLVLLFGVALGSCRSVSEGYEPRLVQPGAPGDASRVVGADAIGAQLPHTEADVRFMQRMIPHHAQALEISELVPDRTTNGDIHLLAQRVIISQQDEIALIRDWLEVRGEAVPAVSADAAHAQGAGQHEMMPGMLTADEMARLAAARGPAFDRLFLLSMMHHHEGALVMVEELFASPGAAQEEEVFQFASHVDADQRIEIARMNRMLNAMP